MMGVGYALRSGFALAHRRLRLILLDVLWEALWLAVTVMALGAFAGWFASKLQSIQWEGSGVPGVDRLLATALMREIWAEYRNQVIWSLIGIGGFSVLLRILLEAHFRASLLGRLQITASSSVCGRGALAPRKYQTDKGYFLELSVGLKPRGHSNSSSNFSVFLLSSIATKLLLLGATVALGSIALGRFLSTPLAEWPALWVESRGVVVVAVVALAGLNFILRIFATVVRSDAVDLLGNRLFELAGVIGTLMLFEAFITASVGVAVVAALLNIASFAELLEVGALAVIAILILIVFHSYLLLVRFSVVGIMKHDVVDI